MQGPKTAFMAAVEQLIAAMDAQTPPGFTGTIDAVLVGGVAVHFHTASRVSKDLKAIFNRRIIFPSDLHVAYRDGGGRQRLLRFDTHYNPTLALMHPDADRDAVPVGRVGRFLVKVLTPLDLAVSKIGRWAGNDADDVAALAGAGLLRPEALASRANEAVDYYIGDAARLRHNLRDALELVERCTPDRPAPP
ncbi:MAG TPA: hypothetical protein VEH84_01050 [Alphaproteobacteria bacterium]|nr:hypothetical protein [Alphaproteobacteria bacterium]